MNNQAQQALHAAYMRRNQGRFAAIRFVQKHGISPKLYRLACQLLAAQRGGI